MPLEALMERTVFDIGMYDGSDTEYYLELGHRVVAVEANPNLVDRATERFAPHLRSGRLRLVNSAITSGTGIGAGTGKVDLLISGEDLGASSVLREQVANRTPIGSYTVLTTSLQDIFREHGVPYYLKIDIEGSDRWCVLALTKAERPQYLSFEVGKDLAELAEHAASIGYTRFRLINQCNFRELGQQRQLSDRIRMRIIRQLGYDEPNLIRRFGRFFRAGHSSGPAPWLDNGEWFSATEILRRWSRATATGIEGWYDLHAQ